MTNRELLEMSAKAAGMKSGFGEGEWFFSANGEAGLRSRTSAGTFLRWNPISDDGDALRLAVKLGMEVTAAPLHAYACRFGTPRGREVDEPHDRTDPCAAVRRAIVRAAAEIGKRMP